MRERFPDARVIEQENKGMGGGNNAGMRVADGRYFFLLNSDAWVVGDALDELVRFADEHPEAAVDRAEAPATPTGRCSARCAASRRSGGSRPSTSSSASSRRARGCSTRSTPAASTTTRCARSDWLFGPALLVRREAVDAVGLFDEDFFMFSEEVDWMTRFRRAGWKVLFFPGAEVVHVGGASHGGRLYVENLRGHLRWFDKHAGPRAGRAGAAPAARLAAAARARAAGRAASIARASASCRPATPGRCSQ